MRVRRLRKRTAELEVTAFINVIVVLVPFLLSTAVFTRLSVVELSLPAQNTGVEQLKVDDLKLEVVIRPDALDVGDRIGGLIQRIPARSATEHDLPALSTLMQAIKAKFPNTTTATVLAQPDTPYEMLVQVMDAVRETLPPPHVKGQPTPDVARSVLFPDISIGDAPISVAAKK